VTAPAPILDPFATDVAERRARRRGVWGWVALGAVVLLLGAFLTLFARADWEARARLDPEGVGPGGARAIVHILRDQGVEVVATTGRDQTIAELDGGGTLVVTDPWPLSDEALRDVVDAADDVVVLNPSGSATDLLVPDAADAGYGSSAVGPGCDLPAAVRAGEIVPGRAFTAPKGVVGCYPVGDGFAVLQTTDGDTRITVVDGTVLFDNEHLAQQGNAALGLGLIGAADRVVWYVPRWEDAGSAAPPTIGELVPPWVTPALTLLLLAGVAAGLWRGRRFGPLVAERLPVTVRGSETLEGRARLYARAAQPAHAADLLRAGATARMARRLGLPPNAAPREVADAAAARLGAPVDVTRAILTHVPATDADLATFGHRLRELEAAVDAARLDRRPP